MREQLKQVDGVADVTVDFGAKTATVKLSKDVDPRKLEGALSGSYSGTVAKN